MNKLTTSHPPFDLFKTPPYCPNPQCRWHDPDLGAAEGRFRYCGSRAVQRFPYTTRRFECLACGKFLSDSYFSPFYRDRTEPTYQEVFNAHTSGQSRRSLALELGCSLDTVQRRFRKLASQGLLMQAKLSEKLRIREEVAYDGIENFAYSQFDPNNINHVVGRESYFVYDFNFSPLNRKGRMTSRQQRKKKLLENRHGSYPRDAIRKATRKILLRLMERAEGTLLFHSDNHYAYRQAIASLPKAHKLRHFITPARHARNFQNRLFAINHLDLLTRQNLTTFKRETISFAKHSIGMIESFTLLMVWKNFLRPLFVKKHKRDPSANVESPAMRVGLAEKVLTFREFFKLRLRPSQVKLSEDWLAFVKRRDPTTRRPIAA